MKYDIVTISMASQLVFGSKSDTSFSFELDNECSTTTYSSVGSSEGVFILVTKDRDK